MVGLVVGIYVPVWLIWQSYRWAAKHDDWSQLNVVERILAVKAVIHAVLCDTWNWNHVNDTVSGIAILDATAIPELHVKRKPTPAIWCRVVRSRVFSRPFSDRPRTLTCKTLLIYSSRATFLTQRRGVYDISLMNNEDRPTDQRPTDLPGCKWSVPGTF